MDIDYFLKMMREKNASDMFLTTGAPLYIKVEGKKVKLAISAGEACRLRTYWLSNNK